MVWQIEFDDGAESDLAKLDKQIARRITKFLRERIAYLDDPRSVGQALKGATFGQCWKYRVGDYRVIAEIRDSKLCILVVRIGNRREVYRPH